MNILSKSRDFDVMALYSLTKSPEITSMKMLADNELLTVCDWVVFEDTDSKGNPVTLLSVDAGELGVYITQSATFMRSFEEIIDIREQMGVEQQKPFTIKKINNTAKSGREFINCVLIECQWVTAKKAQIKTSMPFFEQGG